jgi:hypothetical protein
MAGPEAIAARAEKLALTAYICKFRTRILHVSADKRVESYVAR